MGVRVLRVSHSAVVDLWRERERELERRGHIIELLSANRWDEGGRQVPLEPRPGERVTGVRTWGSHPALFLYDPRAIWRALGSSADVIDLHEEPFALCTAEILALRWLRRVTTPYVLYSAQNIAKRYPPPFRWFERWALQGAAGVSVCNSEAGRILTAKGLVPRPLVIPLGTDLSVFHPGTAARSGPSSGSVRVGYAGRLAEHKGVVELVRAVLGDERLSLLLAGAGPQERQVREVASTAPDRVVFLGPLTDEDLADFYRSIDVLAVPSLVTPSWVEQYGRVAVEAMACGTPVVVTDSGALPEVVGDAGLVVPWADSEALRSALLQVGLDGQLWERLSHRGIERAQATSWGHVAKDYELLYNRAVGEVDGSDLPPLEVVVVAYGAPDLLRQSLAPIRGRFPVTVVDSSSSPAVRSVAQQAGARYLDPGYNGGFAVGVNLGLAARQEPHSDVLLLNPDAVIEPDAVEELQRRLHADPRLASVGPQQRSLGGAVDRVTWSFPTPLGAWLEAVGFSRFRRGPVFVIGSVLLVRAQALADVGGFDESFFLYAEETDWARRAVNRGWRHRQVSTAAALHVGAATSTDPTQRERHFHASQERYYRKHFGPVGWQVARAGQLAGAVARSVLPGERGRAARGRVVLYWRGPVSVEAAHHPRPARRSSLRSHTVGPC